MRIINQKFDQWRNVRALIQNSNGMNIIASDDFGPERVVGGATFVLREGKDEMKPHFKTIGEIRITNKLSATEDSSAYSIAVKLLTISFQGVPVLDASGRVVGKITEMDLLKGLKAGRNLKQIRVGEIMAPPPPVIGTDTTVEEAVEIMDSNHLLRLPVMASGRFIGNITRHDLLRAWLGYWVDQDFAQVIG